MCKQRPQVYWVNIWRQEQQATSARHPGPPRCHWRQTGNSWLFLMRTQLLWTKSHPSLSSLWTSRTDSACLLVLLWSRNTKPAWSFLNAHSVRVCLQFCLKKNRLKITGPICPHAHRLHDNVGGWLWGCRMVWPWSPWILRGPTCLRQSLPAPGKHPGANGEICPATGERKLDEKKRCDFFSWIRLE